MIKGVREPEKDWKRTKNQRKDGRGFTINYDYSSHK